MAEQHKQGTTAAAAPRLRIWPAVGIAAVHFVLAYLLSRFGTTNIHNAIALAGIPGIALILLLVWWLTASRAPVRDRFVGLALFLVMTAAVVLSQTTQERGWMLFARIVPSITHGVVLLLLLTRPLRWKTQRWLLLIFMALATVVFLSLRVDSIGGDLFPVVAWRWTPTAEERSEALGLLETQGTADVPRETVSGDWPAFRGPLRDGRVDGVRFSTDWDTAPAEVWRRDIGSAWSTFAAIGDYLYTQEQRGPYELVACYQAGTGEVVWQNRIEERFEDAMGLGPRATPAFAGGMLYTQGGTGVIQCLEAATGAVVWRRDLREDAGARVPGYGFSSSPLVVEDRVIYYTAGVEGKSVIAYDRFTGEIAWTSGRNTSGYASPRMDTLGGQPQLLMTSNFGLEAFDVDTGAVLWEHDWPISTNPRCTLPVVFNGDGVMWGGTGTSGTRLLRVTREAEAWVTEEQWTTRQFRPYFNDGVLHKGYFYGYDGDRVACLDVDGGRRMWLGERYGGQMLLLADMDMLLILSEAGDVVLVAASPDAFTEVTRFKALTGKTWNHPIIAHGRLYVRNAREAVCFELPLLP